MRHINSTHQIALRALKKKCDNVTQDLLKFSKELPKLHEKGYPETMQQFMQGKVDEVGAVVAEGNTLYAKFVFDSAENNPDNRHAKAAQTKEIEQQLQQVMKAKTQFDKTHGSDIRKLTAK